MRFDVTDLRLFLHVHEAGSITAGAQASHMTLASASERVRGMEDALGVPLLVRTRRGVSATPAGMTLAHHARAVLRQLASMHGELSEYGAGLRGHVRLQCNTSALSEHLPPVLGRFLTSHPKIAVDVEEHASSEIVDALRHGSCDLGVVSDAVDTAGLVCRHFRADPLVLVVPADHALAQHRRAGLADVLDQPFIGLGTSSALHEHLAQQARRLGRRLEYRLRVNSLASICEVVGLGAGVAIVPTTAAARFGRGKLRRVMLTDPWAQRNLLVCHAARMALAAHVQSLLDGLLAAANAPARTLR